MRAQMRQLFEKMVFVRLRAKSFPSPFLASSLLYLVGILSRCTLHGSMCTYSLQSVPLHASHTKKNSDLLTQVVGWLRDPVARPLPHGLDSTKPVLFLRALATRKLAENGASTWKPATPADVAEDLQAGNLYVNHVDLFIALLRIHEVPAEILQLKVSDVLREVRTGCIHLCCIFGHSSFRLRTLRPFPSFCFTHQPAKCVRTMNSLCVLHNHRS